MRILLIYPYCTQNTDHRWYPVEPLGILYVASYLRAEVPDADRRFEIRILDAQMEGPETSTRTARGYRKGMTDEELAAVVAAFSPDIIGITCNYTNNVLDALEIAETSRRASPNSFIVIGGAHATIDHENLARLPYVDAVVRSEGEATFKDIALAIEAGTAPEGISGTTIRSGDRVIVNPDRDLIPDVNRLPVPDRSMLDYGKYLRHSKFHYSCPKQEPIATLFSARGCPYRCIFCSTQKVWRNCWRPRSPENVLKEIEGLIQTYGVREIAFQDDQFMGDRERIKALCRLIISRKLGITMIAPPGISPALVDRETFLLMRKAGFYRVCISIDVGTLEAVRFVKKPVKLDHMRQVVRWANQAGLWTYATFVIGFPHETRGQIEETVRYAYNLKLDHVVFYIAQPHYGSELYDLFVREGWLKPEQARRYHTPAESLYGTRHLSAAQVEELRADAASGYFGRHALNFLDPRYVAREFLPKISTPKRFRYFITICRNLRKVAGRA